jgi:hypothetical protein
MEDAAVADLGGPEDLHASPPAARGAWQTRLGGAIPLSGPGCYLAEVDPRLARLLEIAYRTVPAAEANRAISEAREEAAASGAAASRPPRGGGAGAAPLARSYELVLDPEGQWEQFAAEVLPRLVYHLESLGARPPSCKGMVVAAFVGDRLHFLHAGEMIQRVAELSGISVEELFRRHGTGESRTAVTGPPLPLPPGRGKR